MGSNEVKLCWTDGKGDRVVRSFTSETSLRELHDEVAATCGGGGGGRTASQQQQQVRLKAGYPLRLLECADDVTLAASDLISYDRLHVTVAKGTATSGGNARAAADAPNAATAKDPSREEKVSSGTKRPPQHPSDNPTDASSSKGGQPEGPFIPGLVPQAFIQGSQHRAPCPTLKKSQVDDQTGECLFAWEAKGSRGETYEIQAVGKLQFELGDDDRPVARGLKVTCSCPDGHRQATRASSQNKIIVCKHGTAALESVLDEKEGEATHRQEVTRLRQQRSGALDRRAVKDVDRRPKDCQENAKAKSTSEVIDLIDDDDDDDDENRKPPAKRESEDSLQREDGSKRARRSVLNSSAGGGATAAPIKLFATRSDEEERLKHPTDRDHWSWSQCMTLREMLGFDDPTATSAVQWLVLSNYIVDFEFVLDEVPELLSIPTVAVFFGSADTPVAPWKDASPGSVDFRCLRPSEQPGELNPLRQKIHYGVHHTKMFLVGYSDDRIRVIVHTANLRHNDVHEKAQMAYIQDFWMKKDELAPSSHFEDTLISYLDTYDYRVPRRWLQGSPEPLTACLRRYDFSSASAVLIPSMPGYHPLTLRQQLGHRKLRQAVAEHTTIPESEKPRPIICQFSSIGSLTEKYLFQLQSSMDTGLARERGATNSKAHMRLQLVYPTVEEVRSSVEGYAGGGSVPGHSKNLSKPFLRPLLRKWSTASDANPLWKGRNVPHLKTFYQVNEDGCSLDWCVITSHNLSKAAWGEVQNSRTGARQLFIRHWELGVFISPRLLQGDCLFPWSPDVAAAEGATTVPLPFKLHPEPYGLADRPWVVDESYEQPDRFGRHSVLF